MIFNNCVHRHGNICCGYLSRNILFRHVWAPNVPPSILSYLWATNSWTRIECRSRKYYPRKFGSTIYKIKLHHCMRFDTRVFVGQLHTARNMHHKWRTLSHDNSDSTIDVGPNPQKWGECITHWAHTKWPPFWRRFFQMYFVVLKLYHLDCNSMKGPINNNNAEMVQIIARHRTTTYRDQRWPSLQMRLRIIRRQYSYLFTLMIICVFWKWVRVLTDVSLCTVKHRFHICVSQIDHLTCKPVSQCSICWHDNHHHYQEHP